jgi:thermitase
MRSRLRGSWLGTVAVTVVLLVSQVTISAHAATGHQPGVPDGTDSPFGYRTDVIEVTFKSGVTTLTGLGGRPNDTLLRQFQKDERLQLAEFIDLTHIFVFKLPQGVDPVQRIRALRSNPIVRSASVVAFARTAALPPTRPDEPRVLPPLNETAAEYLVNDPLYASQWALPQIQASDAWDFVTGAFMVGVIDSGINPHEDLLIGGSVNFSADTNADDNYGHGTPMAGIAAALGNNGKGMAGVTGPRNAYVYNIKVIDQSGSSDSTRVANALTWAADFGPSVLNLSLNVSCTQGMLDAIYYAYARGRIVIGSTGNANQSNFNGACPAASVYAIAVGGTNGGGTPTTDKRWCQPCGDTGPVGYGSNYGTPGVDVAAPSTWIYVTTRTGGYTRWDWSGTSGATAHVSGLVALMMYKFGTPTPSWIKNKLHSSAQQVGGYNYSWAPGQSQELGFGRINAYIAIAIP